MSVPNSNPQPSIAPLADRKVSHPINNASQPTSLSPDSDHANYSSTLVEYPHRAIRATPSPETLKKWSRPVAPPSDSVPSQTYVTNSNSRPSIAPIAAQKVSQPINNASQPTSLSPDFDHANSSPTSEYPHRAIGATPPPETLKKWSRPVVPPSDSGPSQIAIPNLNFQPSIAPVAAQKVSQPINNAPQLTSLSPDSDHANSSPTLVEYPHRAIRATPPPEMLKKWSRPVAPPSDSVPSQTSVPNSNSQPSIAPIAAQKVSQPINNAPQLTSLSPDSDHANSSPTLVEYPHRAIRATPPEMLKKWSRPVAPPSDSVPSLISVPNSNSQPPIAPIAAQKVSQPFNNASQPTSLSPDSDHASSSPTSVETHAEKPHRAIHASPPSETLNELRPVVPPSNSILSRKSVHNSNSQSSMAPLAARKVSQPRSNTQPTLFSPDSDHADQSLEKKARLQTPPRQELSSSLDTNSVDEFDEFADKRLRPDAYRRNQKSYFEGRGRHERVTSKVLLQQSANAQLSKKKTSPVPKLIKARRMDVFIPSTLSVAALATLLNVKLGT